MQIFSYERTSLISRYAIVRDVRVAGYLGMKLTEAQTVFSFLQRLIIACVVVNVACNAEEAY